MTPIQTWTDFNGFYTQEVQLFEGKIKTIRKLDNGNIFEEDYSFKDILILHNTIGDVKLVAPIFKKMTEQRKPKGLNAQISKHWNFWKSIDLEKITEQKFALGKNEFWEISKLGIAHVYTNRNGKKHYSRQYIDDFFFYGLSFPDTKLEDRIKAKKIVFNALDNTKLRKKIALSDGFVLFDYNKIEPIELEKITRNSKDFFIIENGKITVTGWNRRGEGGTSFSSPEVLWYYMKTRVQKVFHKHIPQIKAILEKAIIQ